MPSKGTIPRVCRQCRVEFLARRWNVENGRGTFCSRRCASQAYAAAMPGGSYSGTSTKHSLSGWQLAKQREARGLPKYTDAERMRLRAKSVRGANKRKAAIREALKNLKLERGCTDCGFRDHFAALQFDHLPEHVKSFALNRPATSSWATVQREIAKCDVVCANCHAVRTYERRYGQQLDSSSLTD